ncbi:MAG: MBOAT family protein [Desulfobacterales bacterium]|nr:MBOAT family protein [Desulfobacterales bacterium]MDD4072621.1 MBOAT family protein [Desulfobacterales bacterium]MDD4393990.1 MBOAT family protein [Desulfobacterales bacterium]
MVFNSFQFAIFFVAVVGLYFTIPHRYRWMMSLAASYYFYMCWKVEYIVLIAASTLIAYYAGLQMAKTPGRAAKKKYLLLSLTTNLGILFFFKYFNFVSDSVQNAFNAVNIFYNTPTFDVLLPVGISFYTFQTLSYTIDVYKDSARVEKHLGIFALFVAFWPQLVAGPIERTAHLLPQFRQAHSFDYKRVTNGLRRMLWGLFKKVVIADQLAIYVNRVYNHVDDYQGATFIVATIFFAIQIYCDFSGYSDMAIGAARVMGYDLVENFKRPYFSKSVREFWQRWHISLTSWFRDYIYIPLGGNRVVKWRWYYNLMVTFLLSGLWHGANWTFLIWGALHGCYLVMETVTGDFVHRMAVKLFPDEQSFFNKAFRVLITLSLVCFAWIFFRANTVGDALTIITKIFVINTGKTGLYVAGKFSFMMSIVLILILIGVHLKERRIRFDHYMERLPLMVRWMAYTAAVWAIVISGIFGVKQEFIYFQF